MTRGEPAHAGAAAQVCMNSVVDASSTVVTETTDVLVVEVVGTPAPQGSKSYKGHRGGRPVLVECSAAVGPWREAVAWAVRSALAHTGRTVMTGPVAVDIEFLLPRPASAPKSRFWPDRRPDLDKLLRSTLDALVTGGAIADDGQVMQITRCTSSHRAALGGRTCPLDA